MRDGDEFAAQEVERGVLLVFLQIANDRLRLFDLHENGKHKQDAVEIVESVLELWKLQRAGSDGVVRMPITTALPNGRKIKGMRVAHVFEMRPWECAGGEVTCDADLYTKLVYRDFHQDAVLVEEGLQKGVPLALLVERDAGTMSLDALMRSLHWLWAHTLDEATTLAHRVATSQEAESARIKRQATKNAMIAADHKRRKVIEHSTWKRLAVELWRENISRDATKVANMVINRLLAGKNGKKPSHRTVYDYLVAERVHAIVKTQNERSAQRKQNT